MLKIDTLFEQSSLPPLRLAIQKIVRRKLQEQNSSGPGDTDPADFSLDIDEAGKALGDAVLHVLSSSRHIAVHAFPHRFGRPRFSAFYEGQEQGWHTDAPVTKSAPRIRTDLTAVIFLSDRETYSGGALLLRDGVAGQKVKLNAGDALLLPSDTFRAVERVDTGECLLAAVAIQSMIRDRVHRSILSDVNGASSLVKARGVDSQEAQLLQRAHGALMRLWAEV